MNISDFDFDLPKNLIARTPASPRDHSRLLIMDKKSGDIEHKKFYDILSYLKKGDLLILNNSKVFPARLHGEREETGGKVEIFLLNCIDKGIWRCMMGGKRIREGLKIKIKNKLTVVVGCNNKDATWEVDFGISGKKIMDFLDKFGEIPLPPYIEKQREESGKMYKKIDDKKNYQTVFAGECNVGSVAAPTAGLHFTKDLLGRLEENGVLIEYISLHVGMGTFAPVKVDDPKKHKMHSEWVEINKSVINKINKVKKNGGQVVAVGTTTTRSLEALVEKREADFVAPVLSAWVDIFIYPGFEFKIVDAMITNFHLPKSTLLMLVSALAGKGNIDKVYKKAIEKKYRFYSYGDAMFIK